MRAPSRSLHVVVVASALLWQAGCKRSQPAPAPPPDLRFSLLDNGRAPRSQLRYGPKAPERLRLSLSLRSEVEMKLDAKAAPTEVRLPGLRFALEVRGAQADDLRQFEFVITDADLTDTATAQPTMAAAMREDLDQLVGRKADMMINRRGLVHRTAFDAPAGIDPALASYLSSFELALAQLAPPLPEEPVGVGAKWEVEELVSQGGIEVRQIMRYELIAAEGSRLQLATQSVQAASDTVGAERSTVPGLPPGVTAEISSVRGSGSGEVEVDLSRFFPSSAREETNTDVTYQLKSGTTRRPLSLTSTSRLDVQAL